MAKADDAIASADLELKAGHQAFAINRTYYACFYAVTALLCDEGKQFTKHSGVLSEFRRSFIKTGRLDKAWGSFYHMLFEDRHEGDYMPTRTFSSEEVSDHPAKAREFVSVIRATIDGC